MAQQSNGDRKAGSPDIVLIVDDEDPVRKTFREWLEGANLGIKVLSASGAEQALTHASEHTIDLAILDWNLGSGDNGLQLLEDLYTFNPDVVAIMVTGFAHEATPLDAMRMGVRDYFDKSQELSPQKFLDAVKKQLDIIRPAKRERLLHSRLRAFRETVEKVLPLVQSAAALNDPVPLPDAISSLFRFLLRTTRAKEGALFVRSYDPQREPAEICRVFSSEGEPLPVDLVPFNQSLAGTVISMGEPQLLTASPPSAVQEYEKNRTSLLIAPLTTGASMQVVLELFDKQDETGQIQTEGFTLADRQLVESTAELGGALLRQALSEQRSQRALFDAIRAALAASDSLVESLKTSTNGMTAPPPEEVLDELQRDLQSQSDNAMSSAETVRLAEAIRVLALCHGSVAVDHCLRYVESLRSLLDSVSGVEDFS